MRSLLATGDVVRVRKRGVKDDWCVCRVDIVSENGASVGLQVLDGVLRTQGGMMMGALAVMIEMGSAYEVFTQTELEMELKR